ADPPKPAAAGKFTIQVAAFRDRAAAERMLEQFAARGIDGYLEGTPAGIFRVRVGQFESREAARALAARLESEQFATLVTSR
ncbi:MAG: SPOR domain-containing protein, partial [Acidobacteria bacterium]|nr:SPOR domain-containing protein [Acidobacteriota bacterium]